MRDKVQVQIELIDIAKQINYKINKINNKIKKGKATPQDHRLYSAMVGQLQEFGITSKTNGTKPPTPTQIKKLKTLKELDKLGRQLRKVNNPPKSKLTVKKVKADPYDGLSGKELKKAKLQQSAIKMADKLSRQMRTFEKVLDELPPTKRRAYYEVKGQLVKRGVASKQPNPDEARKNFKVRPITKKQILEIESFEELKRVEMMLDRTLHAPRTDENFERVFKLTLEKSTLDEAQEKILNDFRKGLGRDDMTLEQVEQYMLMKEMLQEYFNDSLYYKEATEMTNKAMEIGFEYKGDKGMQAFISLANDRYGVGKYDSKQLLGLMKRTINQRIREKRSGEEMNEPLTLEEVTRQPKSRWDKRR